MNEWEVVALGLERVKVPMGWLYRTVASMPLIGSGHPNVSQTTGVALAFVEDGCCFDCDARQDGCDNTHCPCHRLT